jgi:hypothetical protein
VTAYVEEWREVFGVEPICRAVGVPVSAYCARRSRKPSVRALADRELVAEIRSTFVIGDTPLAIYDPKPRIENGGVGFLSSDQVETTLPLDSKRCLLLIPGKRQSALRTTRPPSRTFSTFASSHR